jgi:hypothetical protein
MNVIVPVGVPELALALACRVTTWPTKEGFGVLLSTVCVEFLVAE